MVSVVYIRPEYTLGFQCDGRVCSSRCCRDWSVAIDPASYEAYAGIEPREASEEICGWISGQDDRGNFMVRLREDRRCPFLRDDFLCRIQQEYGERYLSDICYSYPRVTYRIGGVVEQSMVVSCPVAARLLLGQAGPMRFVEEEKEEGRLGWHFDMTKKVGRYGEDWQDMQSAGILLLQDRRLDLDQCLFSMLQFYEQGEGLLEKGEKGAFGKLLESVEAGDFSLSSVEEGRCGAFQKEVYLQSMMELFHVLYGVAADEERHRALGEIYDGQYPRFFDTLVEQRNLFENYLVNEYFLRLYPYAYEESMAENVKIFVLSWKVMEFALLMMSAQEALDYERILLGIGRMTERLDHNRDAMRAVRIFSRDFFREESATGFGGKILAVGN